MAFQVVSLLTVLLVTSARAQFPMIGGFPGMNPFMQGFQNQGHPQKQREVDPNMLTCINADAQDPQSQIRLTLRPLNNHPGALHPGMGLGFGPMGQMLNNHDQEQDWTIDGIMLPSQIVQKAGHYKVAVFSGGRTFGQCKASALGRILYTNNLNPFLNGMGMRLRGPFSPLGLGMNPFGNMFGGGMQMPPNGQASNDAIVSTGTTMYSGIIRGVSYYELLGRSVGVCTSTQSEHCQGAIAYCCTITRDALPASEVYVDAVQGIQQVNPLAFNQAGLIGGAPGGVGAGGALPLATGGATAVAVGVGDSGLF